jgi:hypothetical protein
VKVTEDDMKGGFLLDVVNLRDETTKQMIRSADLLECSLQDTKNLGMRARQRCKIEHNGEKIRKAKTNGLPLVPEAS